MICLATGRIPLSSCSLTQGFATCTMARKLESGMEKICTSGMRETIMDTHAWMFMFTVQIFNNLAQNGSSDLMETTARTGLSFVLQRVV